MENVVAIGGGHGLYTPGKRTPDDEREWSFNNKVVLAAIERLKEYRDIKVVRMDDPTGQRDIPLNERTNKANAAKADVLVSVHHNALTGKWGDHTGTEIYTYLGNQPGSTKLAKIVQPKLIKAYGLKDRGIKQANFHMVRESNMPAILTEGGYMDSNIDIKVLRDDNKLRDAGVAIADGIAEYFGMYLSEDVAKPKPAESPKPVTVPPSVSASPESVQDWMNANKDKWGDGSYSNRKVVATKYTGISNYSGTADQNVKLLNFVKNNSPKTLASAESVAQDIAAGRGGWGNNPERANKLKVAGYDASAIQKRVNEILKGSTKTATTTSSIKVGDKVTARYLYTTGNDSTADRSTPITGYVDKIDNGWENPYRLVKTKGKKNYLGFARKEHLSK